MSAPILCVVHELSATGAKEFRLGSGDWPLRGFVVQCGDVIAAYVNRCPHAGHPLNLSADRFLTDEPTLILCNSHGALFEPDTGLCVSGPCRGRSLQKLPIRLEGEQIVLDGDAAELVKRFA